ncbi:hypothetical protein [Aeromonas fluvialis]|uniref:hypothetical protein n=1 Tax=Aeromonas fluvialis TaxID=591962 RepID=UPI000B00EADE|nr:hypothetical protein [Aeromonas fluvialis]
MSQQQYRVLVVDDDLKLRSLLERYLTEQGFVVRGVANGEQADRLLTRENFSLMVHRPDAAGVGWALHLPPSARSGQSDPGADAHRQRG